jgi:hypothetical protein
MKNKLIAGIAGLAVMLAGAGVSVAAKSKGGKHPKPPSTVTVKQKFSQKMVPNRYVKDGLRFDKDVYTVKSGGTVILKMTAVQEGPHTLSVVKKKDLPKNAAEANNCAICGQLAQAHGADPNTQGPPKFTYLEDGVGQNTPPNLDKPGDSGIAGPNKGDTLSFHVTAAPGTTLHFMCIIHAQMQAKIQVK